MYKGKTHYLFERYFQKKLISQNQEGDETDLFILLHPPLQGLHTRLLSLTKIAPMTIRFAAAGRSLYSVFYAMYPLFDFSQFQYPLA